MVRVTVQRKSHQTGTRFESTFTVTAQAEIYLGSTDPSYTALFYTTASAAIIVLGLNLEGVNPVSRHSIQKLPAQKDPLSILLHRVRNRS